MRHLNTIMRSFLLFTMLSPLLLPLIVSGGGGPPPPPPPPCPTRSAGCYDSSDNKGDAGTLTAETFGFYISETAYKPGSCSASAAKTIADAQILNPDDHIAACGCIAGADFDTQVEAPKRCCGDDKSDCGMVSKGSLCSIDANSRDGIWKQASATGDIVHVGCQNTEYVTDGTSWIPCTSTEFKRTIGGHEYLCTGSSSIAECAGSDTCKAKTAGKCLQTGGAIASGQNSSEEKVNYCLSTKKIVTDLDNTNQPSCEAAKNLDGTPGNFKWTGTKCCSEADDSHEHYNDQTGGCWDSKPVISIGFVDDVHDVGNFDGIFYGCVVSANNYLPQNNGYLSLTNTHTTDPLITDSPYCARDPTQTFYCSFKEKWLPTGGEDKTTFKRAPMNVSNTNATSQAECCAPTQCWDGQACADDQASTPTAENALPDFRCISGNWTRAVEKTSLGGDSVGFCPDASQCLVNPNGKPEDNNNPAGSPQCIADKQYIKDDFCFGGNWSARTTQIALQMLDMKSSGSYSLFCDKTQDTLNFLEYLTLSGKQASLYFGTNANNVCVLKQGSTVVVGASFNTAFTDAAALDLFGVQSCSGAQQTDGQYHKCDTAGSLWYNKKAESILYSKTALNPSQPSFFSMFSSFLSNPLQNLISTLQQKLTSPPFPISDLTRRVTKFQRLYITEQGTKRIFGVLQDNQATVEYANFNSVNICDYASQFTQQVGGSASGIACTQTGQTYQVLAQGSPLTTFQPEQAWPDLTSKVRLT